MLNLFAVPPMLLLPAPQEASPQEPATKPADPDQRYRVAIRKGMQECLSVKRPLEFRFQGGKLVCIRARVAEVPRKETGGGYRTPARKRPGTMRLVRVIGPKGETISWEPIRRPGRRVPRVVTLLPILDDDGFQLVKGYARELRRPRQRYTRSRKGWKVDLPEEIDRWAGVSETNATASTSTPKDFEGRVAADYSGQWKWPPELLKQLQ